MAPINLPDGTEVSEVVLPDGSTASKVLAPDGSTVFAAIPDVVDDFEDSDLSEWTIVDSAITSSTVYQGTYAMEVNQADDSGFDAEYSTSGLDRYPKQGETFEFYANSPDSQPKSQFLWGVQDTSNFYLWLFNWANSSYELSVVSGGSPTTLDTGSWDQPTSQWLRMEVNWASDGTITCNPYYDSDGTSAGDTLTATDTTYSSGGIGNVTADGNWFLDLIRVIAVE